MINMGYYSELDIERQEQFKLFPIKVKSFEHILKMFALGDKIVLCAGGIDMLVDEEQVREHELGMKNWLLKGCEIIIKGVK